MPTRNDLRNVAIVAHVDHGKTTLVDALLRQAGALGRAKGEGTDNDTTQDRVMDSMDLERERGITILAKNTAIRLADGDGNPSSSTSSTPPATPTSVARSSAVCPWSTASCCWWTPPRARCRRPRFVLRKALGKGMPVILAVNKTDRADARIEEVVDECYELFMELLEDAGLPAESLEFPIVYCNGRTGQASLTKPRTAPSPTARTSAAGQDAAGHHPGPRVRRRGAAARAGHQPRRLPVPGPAGAAAHPLRRDEARPAGRLVQGRRHHHQGQDHRAALHRGPHPRAGRVRRPR